MSKRTIIQIVISALVAALSAFLCPDFSEDNIGSLYESLRDTSSIIFAVICIWISIMYPKDLKKILTRDKENTELKQGHIELLSKCIKDTTLTVISTVVIRIVCIPIIYKYTDYKNCSDSVLFALLCFLTIFQLLSLIITLYFFENKKKEINHIISKEQRYNSKLSNTQKR